MISENTRMTLMGEGRVSRGCPRLHSVPSESSTPVLSQREALNCLFKYYGSEIVGVQVDT